MSGWPMTNDAVWQRSTKLWRPRDLEPANLIRWTTKWRCRCFITDILHLSMIPTVQDPIGEAFLAGIANQTFFARRIGRRDTKEFEALWTFPLVSLWDGIIIDASHQMLHVIPSVIVDKCIAHNLFVGRVSAYVILERMIRKLVPWVIT